MSPDFMSGARNVSGESREEVLYAIVSRGIEDLVKNGLLGSVPEILEDASKKGYIPIKIPEER